MAQRSRSAAAGARPAGRTGAAPGGQRQRPGRGAAGGAELKADPKALRERLTRVVEPVVLAAGLDLEALFVTRAGRRHLVRVVVDGDGGVGHDELSDVSREVSAALDAAESTDPRGSGLGAVDSYTLEVSSPGVDRPLTLPRHWRRNVGRLVKVRVGDRTLTARIAGADDSTVTLDTGGRILAVDFDQLGSGRVQVEFNRLTELADEDFDDEITDDEITDDEITDDELADGELADGEFDEFEDEPGHQADDAPPADETFGRAGTVVADRDRSDVKDQDHSGSDQRHEGTDGA